MGAGIYKRFKVMYNNNMENQAEIEKIKGIIANTLSNKGCFGDRRGGDSCGGALLCYFVGEGAVWETADAGFISDGY